MSARVLLIGPGDVGTRVAMGLAASGRVGEVVLAGLSKGTGDDSVAIIESSYDCRARFLSIDATRQADVEALLKREKPDLVMQAGTLLSPWALLQRTDARAKAIKAAGLGLQLPVQLPILLAVMRAVREVGFAGPVANVSLPDIAHQLLANLGLAPTIGLGNVSMLHLRVRAALRRQPRQAERETPVIRVVGHHNQIYGALTATPPADPQDSVQVYLGEGGDRADHLAYQGGALPAGPRYNEVTAVSTLPVLLALLPGGQRLRFSAPAPMGLPGGYPITISNGEVALDLPAGVARDDAIARNARMTRGDGVQAIDGDGTVHFTEAAQAAVAKVAPDLAEPLPIRDLAARAERLLQVVNG